MEVFKSRGPRGIYVPRIGLRVKFDRNGEYRTDDETEIKALKKNRNVELITSKEHGADTGGDRASLVVSKEAAVLTDTEREELEQDLTPGSDISVESKPVDSGGRALRVGQGGPEPLGSINHKDYTRPVLDAMAENLGINPKEYGNKQTLTKAINEARSRRG